MDDASAPKHARDRGVPAAFGQPTPDPTTMRHPSSRPAPLGGELDPAALAEAAREVAAALPPLAQKAEAGGLAIVAQHLRKALELAERVAASGPPAQDH